LIINKIYVKDDQIDPEPAIESVGGHGMLVEVEVFVLFAS
jgi:hypothetical protein